MSADSLVSVAWTVVLSAAGLSVVVVLSVAGLLWVRSISPKDIRFRLDTVERKVDDFADALRRTATRERSASRRAEARGELPAAEPDPSEDGTKPRPPDVAARLAAIRTRLGRV